METQRQEDGGSMVWAVVLLVLAVVIAVFMLSSGASALAFLLPIALAALGLWLLVGALRRSQIGRPLVNISKVTLAVGEPFTITYRMAFKRAAEIDRISIQYIMRESATYEKLPDPPPQPSDPERPSPPPKPVRTTETYEHRLIEENLPGRRFAAGEVYTIDRTFRVPADAMHTFNAHNNTVTSRVTVQTSLPNLPDYVDVFDIRVLPEWVTNREA